MKWAAHKLAQEGGKTVCSAEQAVAITDESQKLHSWMSKEEMVKDKGEKKAASLIASGNLEHRPCPLTGLDDEYNREYKVLTDVGSHKESERHSHKLVGEKEVAQGSQLDEAKEDMAAAANFMGEPKKLLLTVKQERSDGTAGTTVDEKGAEQNDDEIIKTANCLKDNPRAVLRTCSDTILTIKQMYEATTGGKYQEQLREDLGKLLPGFKSRFNTIEKLTLKPLSTDEAELEQTNAILYATKLAKDYDKYNELAEWYSKFHGKVKATKRARKT